LLGQFFVEPVEFGDGLVFDPSSLSGLWHMGTDYAAARPEEERLAVAADELIAWHPLFRAVDWDERRLSEVRSAPRRLSEEAVAWAHQSNWLARWLGLDDALPETLHFAVRSTRYGCRLAGGHGAYSQAAYKRYISSIRNRNGLPRHPIGSTISAAEQGSK
jgi:hypothetical protein